MSFRRIFDAFPIMFDIVDRYNSLRDNGINRDDSLKIVYEEYRNELNDEDDRNSVIIGIAIALYKAKEATKETMEEAKNAIKTLTETVELPGSLRNEFENLSTLLSDETNYNESNRIKKLKKYRPDWIIGDTFVHPVSLTPENEILRGYYIVFRKIGEYIDNKGHNIQLVYTTVCTSDNIPDSDEALHSLGFLRMMNHGDKWDYIGQIQFKSKKDEDSWGLRKIGNFPNAGVPSDATIENPIVAMPLFGLTRHNGETWLSFEDWICHFYKFYGTGK